NGGGFRIRPGDCRLSGRRNPAGRRGAGHVQRQLRRALRKIAGETSRTKRAGREVKGMIFRWRSWRRAVVLAAAVFLARPAHATISYAVSVAHPERHVFGITMNIPG